MKKRSILVDVLCSAPINHGALGCAGDGAAENGKGLPSRMAGA